MRPIPLSALPADLFLHIALCGFLRLALALSLSRPLQLSSAVVTLAPILT
jgi:hypothetical protein